MPRITTKKVGAGGSWTVIDERPDPSVVKQLTPHSCIAAVGEMLLRNRGISVSQEEIIDIIGELSTPQRLASLLNRIDVTDDGFEWFGGIVEVDGPEVLIGLFGAFAAVLREGDPLGHLVLVEDATEAGIEIKDPWEGTTYRMTRRDFLSVWDGGIVQRWNL